MKQAFDVTGMACSACSAHVEKAVAALPGVHAVSVNLMQNKMQVEYDESALAPEGISAAVAAAGYAARPAGGGSGSAASPADAGETGRLRQRLWASVVLLLLLLYISMGHMMGLPLPGFLAGMQNAVLYGAVQLLLTLGIAVLNFGYFTRGFSALFRRSPTMDTLVAVGSTAAILYGIYAIFRMAQGLSLGDMALVEQYHMDLYFESAGTILTLVSVGKYWESRSKGHTTDAIRRLLSLAPPTATRLKNGQEETVPLEEIICGDLLVVRAGQTIPVDGELTEGNGAVDESAITGESLPVDKAAGDPVTGATLCRSGYFIMKATRVGEDTTLRQIVRLVEDASATKAPIARLADRVAAVFVPVVMGIALLSVIVWLAVGESAAFALSIGIAVLVISCPCALGLATPTAIMVGTGRGAEYGILVKSAEALERARGIDTVVLDKTGTVTTGHPAVTDEVIYDSLLLPAALSLEVPSEHPLAEAVVAYCREKCLAPESVEQFEAIAGGGLRARWRKSTLLGGNRRLLEQNGVSLDAAEEALQQFTAEGKTPLFFALDKKLLGILAIADPPKESSAAAIGALRQWGAEVILLTGDNRRTAEAIGRGLAISRVIADVLPQEKEAVIRSLQSEGKTVAMIGDGINDAPALTRADVGIAIGAGTDIAIESADIVLMHSDLRDAAAALQLSRSVIRNIKENLFWAFFYNSIGIPLAAGVFYAALGWKLSPMFASAAMSLSSVFVVGNALRLRRWKPQLPEDSLAGKAAPESASDTFAIPAEELPVLTGEDSAAVTTRTLVIEGMMCDHCKGRVEAALNALPGVSATVQLARGTATISETQPHTEAELTAAVQNAGYQVTSIR